jgi:hypothetical protein
MNDERTVLSCQQAFGGLSCAAGCYPRYRIGSAMALAYRIEADESTVVWSTKVESKGEGIQTLVQRCNPKDQSRRQMTLALRDRVRRER